MLMSFLYRYNKLIVRYRFIEQKRWKAKIIALICAPFRLLVLHCVLNKKYLTNYANKFNTKELFFICSLIKTQEMLDALYEACTTKQKAELVTALDSYRGITSLTPNPSVLYPSVSLLQRDYEELIKTVYPEHYEPEEVALERSFSW